MDNLYGWDLPPQDLLINYTKKCKLIAENDEEFANFRRDPDYIKVLEGDDYKFGRIYLNKIVSRFGINAILDNIEEFRKNDIYGNPLIFDYGEVNQINHNTLLYIYNTLDAKSFLREFQPKIILEIGGGYGGLCRIFSTMFDFDKYVLLDLPPAIEVCKRYLKNYPELYKKVEFITTEQLQSIDYIINIDLAIAIFSMSECNEEVQNTYIDKILMNSKYAYLAYNRLHIPYIAEIYRRIQHKLDTQFSKEFDFGVTDCLYIYLKKGE